MSKLLKKLQANRTALLIFVAGVSVACLVTLAIMLLQSLGVFNEEHPAPVLQPTVPPTALAPSQAGDDLLPGCLNLSSAISGKVVEVIDGDSIKVLLPDGIAEVRYLGVDTPEVTAYQTKIGMAATQKNIELTLEKQVTLYSDQSQSDRYGRLLRYVFVGDQFVNAELVKSGFAEEQPYEPDTACRPVLLQAENAARKAHLGIWQVDNSLVGTVQNQASDIELGNYLPGSILISEVNKYKEYVLLKNNSSEPINLSGWMLVSERGDQYCQLSKLLEPNATLKVFTRIGKGGFSCNLTNSVWSNTSEDPAALYDPAGNLIDRK